MGDLLRESGRGRSMPSLHCSLHPRSVDQTKDLENLNRTLENRCEQLQSELNALRQGSAQSSFGDRSGRRVDITVLLGHESSGGKELKNENKFLKDHNLRLVGMLSEYQATYPSETLKNDMAVGIHTHGTPRLLHR